MGGPWASHAAVAAIVIAAFVAPNSTESTVANGDTRTIVLSNAHTSESGSFTYMVNGVYDQSALDQLNWFLRDWRLNEATKMDPRLFDIVWEVYRESGSREPIDVLSGYRSPQTNAMLRRRSRQVAAHSQHMEGKAIDAHFVDVGPARIRDIAMRMQEGGVGFYPTGVTPWVHIDSGSIRYWPRMSRDALARLFPDGKTVFIPADGQPMPGYEQARAEIEARGGNIQTAGNGGFFAWLFGPRGGGEDDAEEGAGQETLAGARSGRSAGPVRIADAVEQAKLNLPTGPAYVSAAPSGRGGGAAGGRVADAGEDAIAQAKLNLPTGPAVAGPAPQPQVVAAPNPQAAEGDAAPDDGAKALAAAPLPPRRPSDLQFSGGAIPLPPVRPTDLVAAAPDETGSAAPLPPIRPAGLIVSEPPAAGVKILPATGVTGPLRLPKAILGVASAPPADALALAEAPGAAVDDEALLARAAQLTAPLPPMPIPNVGAPATNGKAAPARGDGFARLFGGLPVDAFKPTSLQIGLRPIEQ
ncbi:MAG: DUF882 domain-containing protein [Hyphomicrobiales bacterium]|nr:DUF882 domain-containing protein [Hyphomicrobiales bacterium]